MFLQITTGPYANGMLFHQDRVQSFTRQLQNGTLSVVLRKYHFFRMGFDEAIILVSKKFDHGPWMILLLIDWWFRPSSYAQNFPKNGGMNLSIGSRSKSSTNQRPDNRWPKFLETKMIAASNPTRNKCFFVNMNSDNFRVQLCVGLYFSNKPFCEPILQDRWAQSYATDVLGVFHCVQHYF